MAPADHLRTTGHFAFCQTEVHNRQAGGPVLACCGSISLHCRNGELLGFLALQAALRGSYPGSAAVVPGVPVCSGVGLVAA